MPIAPPPEAISPHALLAIASGQAADLRGAPAIHQRLLLAPLQPEDPPARLTIHWPPGSCGEFRLVHEVPVQLQLSGFGALESFAEIACISGTVSPTHVQATTALRGHITGPFTRLATTTRHLEHFRQLRARIIPPP